MKIGEVWIHKNKKKLLASDMYAYEDGDEKIKITDIGRSGERIFFTHLKTGVYGVLWREHFIKSYTKDYNENR